MATESFDSWAVVELMGHVRTAGRVTEEERFGVKMGRVDVPTGPIRRCDNCDGTGDSPAPNPDGLPCVICNGHGQIGRGFTTVYFGGQSVYRLTPCTEEAARAVATRAQPEPVHQWELPKPKDIPSPIRADDEDDYDDDSRDLDL